MNEESTGKCLEQEEHFHGHDGKRKTFEVMTSTQTIGTIGSVAFLLAATLYQGNPACEINMFNIENKMLDISTSLGYRFMEQTTNTDI